MKSSIKKHLLLSFVITCFLSVNIFPTDLCGQISGTLTLAGSPYIVTCNVLILDGETLTIEAGVVIKFDLGKILEVAGTLIAEGMFGNRIKFTANDSTPEPGDWGQIYFMRSENSSLRNCIIEYAGAGASPNTAINLFFSDVSIRGTTIRKTLGSGMNISESAPSISLFCLITENTGIGIDCDVFSAPIIKDSEISNNGDYAISMYAHNINNIGAVTITGNGKNSIRMKGSGINTGIWLNHGVPYVIDGSLTVNDGQILIIDAGNELRFNGDHTFKVDGTLIANGSFENQIKFVSNKLNPSPGDWRQLNFNNSDPGTSLRFCLISNGGSNTASINMLNSNPFLDEVRVVNSATSGINLSNSSPQIVNGWIIGNAGLGVIASFDSDPILNSCIIQDNGDYAISMYADNIKI